MKRPHLNKQLVLEAMQRVADGAGGYLESWESVGSVWAELKLRSSRQREGEAGPVSARSFLITVRGAPIGQSNRPVAGQRFRASSRLFRIDAVTEADQDGLYLICHCEEERAI